MPNIARDILKRQDRVHDSRYAPKVTYVRCVTVGVDNPGDPSVSGKPGYIWVRELGMEGAVFQCFNPSTQPLVNLPVVVAKDPSALYRRIVVGVDWSALPITSDKGDAATYNMIRHSKLHEWTNMNPGVDAVNIYMRALVPLRVQALYGYIAVSVQPGWYYSGSQLIQFEGSYSLDLSDYVPVTADSYVHVLVYLDIASNSVAAIAGEESTESLPEKPDAPLSSFPLAYVRLYTDMTSISELDITEDARVLFSITSTSMSAILGAIVEVEELVSRHITEGL